MYVVLGVSKEPAEKKKARADFFFFKSKSKAFARQGWGRATQRIDFFFFLESFGISIGFLGYQAPELFTRACCHSDRVEDILKKGSCDISLLKHWTPKNSNFPKNSLLGEGKG